MQRFIPTFKNINQLLGIYIDGIRVIAEVAHPVPYGLVRIEFMGEITAGRVIFGESGCEPLLGVTALESVGIIVDPTNKTLKRLPAIPLK